MPDTTLIETPVSSGTTDNPDAQQESQQQLNAPVDVSANEASAAAAGYPSHKGIEGLPAGAIVRPVANIEGLPAGAIVRPSQTIQPRPDFSQNPPPAAGPAPMQEVNTISGRSGPATFVQSGAEGNAGTGIVKGALETGHTAGALIGKVMPDGWRDNLGLPATTTEPDYLHSQGWQETVGKGLEGLAEFYTGTEALAGLSEASRAAKLLPVMKFLEEHTSIRAAAQAAMDATRAGSETGLVLGGQEYAHGGTDSDVAHATELGLGMGAGGSLLKSVIPSGVKAVNNRLMPEAEKAAQKSEKVQTGIADIAA